MRKIMLRSITIVFLQLLLCNLTIYGADYVISGTRTLGSADLVGGRYSVDGDLIIEREGELKIATSVILDVKGNINIQGKITSTDGNYNIYLTSREGDINIDNEILISGKQGASGENGGATQNGRAGHTGWNSDLMITAQTGDITVNAIISNGGGQGGTGGKGGGSDGDDAGNGGSGGTGGQGGEILLVAEKGKVVVNRPIVSNGGQGGIGGEGGPDVTISGGPGDGGTGGKSGSGGVVTIIGQEIVFSDYNWLGLIINPGEPGPGGAGGDHGSVGGDGDDGASGSKGNAGSVNVAAGRVYKTSTQITNLDQINIYPSGALRELLYDRDQPPFPTDIIFDNVKYNDTYFTDDIATIKVKLLEDHGVTLDDIKQIYDGKFNIHSTIELKSGLNNIEVFSQESSMDRLGGGEQPIIKVFANLAEDVVRESMDDGYYSISFRYSDLDSGGTTQDPLEKFGLPTHGGEVNTVYHLNLVISDKNNNQSYMTRNSSEYFRFSFDTKAPNPPAMSPISIIGDTTVQFSWTPPRDQSGIQDYDLWLNGQVVQEDYLESTYTHDFDYNQEVNFKVKARDHVGNQSIFSEVVTYYTSPQETRIRSAQAQYDSTWGDYRAIVNFENIGNQATGYELKCYEVTSIGERVYANGQYDQIQAASGSDSVVVFNHLTPHRYYKFEIRTVNGDVEDPAYSNWIPYGPIQVANSQPTQVQPTFPDDTKIFNRSNFDTFQLKTTKSSDYDNDNLTYALFINGAEQNDQAGIGATSVTFHPLLSDGTYTWFVRTRDGYGGETDGETSRTFILDQTPPGIPSFSVTDSYVCSTTVQLEEIAVAPNDSDVEKLTVWSDRGGQSVDLDLDTINSSYSLTIPNQQGKHVIHLQAMDDAGNESLDSYQVEVIYDQTPPNQPSEITVTSDSQALMVDWADGTDRIPATGIETSGVAKYKLRYREVGDQAWSEQEVLSSEKRITGLAEHAGYEIQIKAIDRAGNESDWTAAISRYTKPGLGSLEFRSTGYRQNSVGEYQHFVELTVNPGASEKYRIIRQQLVDGQPSGEEVTSGWLDHSQLMYTDDTGILPYPDGMYQYKIETINADESGTRRSSPILVEVANNLPDQPVNTLTGFTSQSRPTLGANSVSDPDGHGLTYYYYIDEVDETGTRTPIVTGVAANHSGDLYQPERDLVDGYTYYYRVRVVEDHQKSAFEAGDQSLGVISDETSFTLDQTPPQITIDLPEEMQTSIENGDPVASVTVTVSAIDQNPLGADGLASGLRNHELTIYFDGDRDQAAVISSGSQVTMNEGGIHTLYVIAQDYAGNETQTPAELTVHVDDSAPEIANFNLQSTSFAGTHYTTNGSELYATFILQDVESGITSAEYMVVSDQERSGASSLPDRYWQPITLQPGMQNHYSLHAPYSPEEGRGYYLLLRATNGVGMKTNLQSERVVVDTIGPKITFSDSQGTLPNMYQISSLADLTLQVTVTDVVSSTVTTEYSLIEGRQESLIVNPVSTLGELSETNLVDGSIYYLAVRSTDLVGHTSVEYSLPILYDQTPPVIEALRGGNLNPITGAILPQRDGSQLHLYWKMSDEVNLSQICYAIGTQVGGTDVSGQLPGNKQGWLQIDSLIQEDDLTIGGLNLLDGNYYLTIKVTNQVGLVSTKSLEDPIEINSSLAVTPMIVDDGIYSQFEEIHFTVAFPNPELLNQSYVYQILDQSKTVLYQNELANPDQLVNVSVSVGPDLLALSSDEIYFVQLGKIVNGQFEAVAYSDGIQIDSTAPVLSYLEDGTYFQPKEIELYWQGEDQQSGIVNYLMQVGTTRGGDELTNGWIPLGVQTSTTLPDLSFQEGVVYYVTLKAINGAGLETQIMGDGFEVDQTAPSVPLVLPGATYTNDLTQLSASWLWSENGIEADAGSGVQEYYYDILEVRDDRGATWKPITELTGDPLSQSGTFTNLNLVNGTIYYIAIKAVDGVGLSSVGFSEGIMADTQAPDLPSIDQLRDYQSFTDQLTAQFASSDDESGLEGFQYSIETLAGDLIVDWTNLYQATTTVSNLSLTEGQVYRFAAQAFDYSGLYSVENKSQGILIDGHLPVIDSVRSDQEYATDADQLFFQWESSYMYTPIVGYEYAIDRSENPTSYNWKTTLQQQIAVSPVDVDLAEFVADGQPYYFFVRAKDRFGRYSEIQRARVVIDATPPSRPVILRTGQYQSNQLLLAWESRDPESRIAEYQYALGTERGLTDVTSGWVTVQSTDQQVQVERADLLLEHNRRYYLVVKVKNNAGVWSEVGYDDGFLVDLVKPQVTEVVGPEGYHNDPAEIKDISFATHDDEVGLKAYRYQLVLAADKEEITDLSTESILFDQGNGTAPKTVTMTFDATGLSLVEGECYYLAIQTQNILNMWSPVVFTQLPFVVDITPPMLSFARGGEELVVNIEDTAINVEWNTDETGTAYYRLRRPTGTYLPADGYSVEKITSTDLQSIVFDQSGVGTYQLQLYMVDEAGNESSPITQQIRVNAPPTIRALSFLTTYKGRALTPTSANFEIQDSDGQIANYHWNFGDQTPEEDSTDFSHAHAYQKIGSYTLRLTVTDNDGATATATLDVTVTNTLSGELHLDEIWSGRVELKDEIIVPVGVLLTIEPGTTVIVPLGKGIQVHGTIDVNGGLAGGVLFTTFEPSDLYGPNLWKGIYVSELSSLSQFTNTTIQYAERGLALQGQAIQINYCNFIENGIGIHLQTSSPVILNSHFESNLYYGIKEETGCAPTVTTNTFVANGLAPYYDDEKTLLTVEEINALLGYGNE